MSGTYHACRQTSRRRIIRKVCRSKFGGLDVLQTKRRREVGILICFLNALFF